MVPFESNFTAESGFATTTATESLAGVIVCFVTTPFSSLPVTVTIAPGEITAESAWVALFMSDFTVPSEATECVETAPLVSTIFEAMRGAPGAVLISCCSLTPLELLISTVIFPATGSTV